jgi:hypothetical protein
LVNLLDLNGFNRLGLDRFNRLGLNRSNRLGLDRQIQTDGDPAGDSKRFV